MSTFDKKLQHSIELLKKSEELALRYNKDGFFLAFSGGKDSQALYHVAVLAGVKFKSLKDQVRDRMDYLTEQRHRQEIKEREKDLLQLERIRKNIIFNLNSLRYI